MIIRSSVTSLTTANGEQEEELTRRRVKERTNAPLQGSDNEQRRVNGQPRQTLCPVCLEEEGEEEEEAQYNKRRFLRF